MTAEATDRIDRAMPPGVRAAADSEAVRARLVGLLTETQRRLKDGLPAAAERACREALALAPELPDALNFLSVALGRQGRPADGLTYSRRALAARPDDPGYLVNLGNRLKEQALLGEAIAAYQRAVELDPQHTLALKSLARALADAGQWTQAAEVARKVVERLDDQDPEALAGFAEILVNGGDPEGSLAVYRRALAVDPERLEWRLQEARLAITLERMDEARAAAEQVLELADHAEARAILASVLHRRREFTRMAEVLEGVPPEGLQGANAANLTGMLLAGQGRIEEALPVMRPIERLAPDAGPLQMTRTMYLNYDPELSREALSEAHRAFGRHFEHALAPVVARFDRARDPERRLRIGYLSPDFRGHSVSYFVSPIFEAFNRERFDTVAYAHLPTRDRVSDHMQGLASEWHDVHRLNDEQLARKIHDDRIDILVELAGLTRSSRLLACTARPAPIQISYIGYPNTTGLPQIDYRITDHVADPEDVDELYTETLIRLPRCFLCYAIPLHAPPVGPLPAATNGYVTFGSFNNLAKVNRKVVATWAEVLDAVPDSRLLIKAAGSGDAVAQGHLREAFASAGIAAERIRFAEYASDLTSHMDVYNQVDIALDTFPYNGTTTTCEALWMGVPVITLAGDRHASRVGASLLSAIGFTAGIAASVDDYVSSARLLAENPSLVAAARRHLRADLCRSPLCDMHDHTRSLEEAYRAVWHLWCERTA